MKGQSYILHRPVPARWRTYLPGDDGRADHDLEQLVEDEGKEADESALPRPAQVRDRPLQLCLKVGVADTRRNLAVLRGMDQTEEPVQVLVLGRQNDLQFRNNSLQFRNNSLQFIHLYIYLFIYISICSYILYGPELFSLK